MDEFNACLTGWLSHDGLWKKVAAQFRLSILEIEATARSESIIDQRKCATRVVEHLTDLLPPDLDLVAFRTSWLTLLRGCDLEDLAGSVAIQCGHDNFEWMTASVVTMRPFGQTSSSIEEAFYPRMLETPRGYAEYKCAMHGLLEQCMPAIEPLVRAFISVAPVRPESLVHPSFMSTGHITLMNLRDSRTLEWLIVTPYFDPLMVFVFAHASEHIAGKSACPLTIDRIHKFREEINARLRTDLVLGWMMKPAEIIERICTRYRESLDAIEDRQVLVPDGDFMDCIRGRHDGLYSRYILESCDSSQDLDSFRLWLKAFKFSELVELFRPLWDERHVSCDFDYPFTVRSLGVVARTLCDQ